MNCKAIFFDVDGTLLSFKTHQVSKGTIRAFEELRKRGILTFLATGRPKALLPKIPLSFDGYVLMNGGYCFVGDKVLVRHPVDRGDLEVWLRHCRDNGMSTMAFTEDESYVSAVDESCLEINRQMGIGDCATRPLEELGEKDVFQFLAIQPAYRDAETLRMLPHCRMPRWHELFCDVIPDGISKAVGIREVVQLLGIPLEETMAFGDGQNDIEMLELVGNGVAMGNASDEVKRHAKHVTTSVDEEGVMTALKSLKVIE